MSDHNKIFQIFKAGTHVSMNGASSTYSHQDLEHIAVGYSKKGLRAPLVLGHPADNRPDYGEVDALFVKGEGLYAQATVKSALFDAVKAQHYTSVSASFYAPDSLHNPTPGVHYLRHVGFLGAMPPAVKGMAPLNFAEVAGTLNFAEGFRIQDASYMHPLPALPPGYLYDSGRAKLFMLAAEYQRDCPAISFSEAAQRAELVINSQF